MGIFAKLFTDQAEENQLVVQIVNTDGKEQDTNELTSGVRFSSEQDGAFVEVTVGGMSYEAAEAYLAGFDQAKADEILVDPIEYFLKLINN